MKMERDYVEIAGIKWATMNVGAEKETDFGMYFQYGSKQGYMHPTNLCNFDKTPKKFYDSVQSNWGYKWRMPTKGEFESLLHNTTNEWVKNYKDSSVNGRLFTDKTDSSKTLFFPACGFCFNGCVNYADYFGYYWSSSFGSNNAWFLYFDNNGDVHMGYGSRYYGSGIRGVLADK